MISENQGGLCTMCGREMTDDDCSSAPLCSQCSLDAAERKLGEQRASSQAGQPDPRVELRRRQAWRTGVVWTVGVLSAAVILFQLPAVFRAATPQRALYAGTVKANSSAEACIANLWKASADMSEGRKPSPSLVCPASKQPYRVTTVDGVTVVACPTPQEHKLTSLTVKSTARVPEVR